VEVVEGRNIPFDSHSSNPYCSIDIHGKTKKTRTIKKSTDCPQWNEKFEFHIDSSTTEFDIHLYDYVRWTSDVIMGDVKVSLLPIDQILNSSLDKWYPVIKRSKRDDKAQKQVGELHVKTSLTLKQKKPHHGPGREDSRAHFVPPTPPEDPNSLLSLVKKNDFNAVADFLLVATPEEVNKTDKYGYTALHQACADKEGDDRIILSLLEFEGINVTMAIPSDNNTALHYFCQNFSSPDCAEAFNHFIQKNADVNAKNDNGETPLFKAIFNNSIRLLLVELLLDNGANVNIVNSSHGEGVLHYAVRLQRSDLVSVLIKAGADLKIRGRKAGKTPYELALQDKNEEMANMLKEAEDMIDWLAENGLQDYTRQFLKDEVTRSTLKDVDDKRLRGMKITDATAQKKIMAALAPLKVKPKEVEVPTPPPIPNQPNANDLSSILQELNLNNKDWIINATDLEFVKKLGAGTSGEVFKGLYKGKPVAIKLLKEMMAEKELDEFKKEFTIMSALRSPYVVYFFGACLKPKMCMVMEFCDRGSLYHVLTDEKLHIGWDKFFSMGVETCKAIEVLHSWDPQIMHRDLKSLNLLVTKDWHVKVCDFGLSRFDTADNMDTMRKMRGTMAFCAPEVYRGLKFTPKSDVYSLGMVLWEMMIRVIKQKYEQPYSEYKHLQFDFQIIIQAATKNLRPTIPETCPPTLQELLKQCMDRDAEPRPTAAKLTEEVMKLEQEYLSNPEPWERAIIPAS